MHNERVCYLRNPQTKIERVLVFIVMPLMTDGDFEAVMALTLIMFEGPVSNHGLLTYQKVQIGLNGHSDKPSDSSDLPPFFPSFFPTRTQPITFTAHLTPLWWSWSPAVHPVALQCE